MAMSPLEVIKKFMASLDKTTLSGTAALDEAIKAATNGKFKTSEEVINKMIEDCQSAKSADDFLKNYCGINLDNEDCGAITGSDAGGSTVLTEESIIPEVGNVDENFNKNSFEVDGLIVKLTDTNDNEINFSDLNDNQKFIWQWLHTFGIKGALNLISDSYGENFSFTDKSSATVKTLDVAFVEKPNSGIFAETYNWSSDNSDKTTNLRLEINVSSLGSVNLDVANSGIDRLIAHEMTHAVMVANLKITTYRSLPRFIREGMAELTIGIDNTRVFENTKESIIQYLSKNVSELQKALNDNGDIYAGGFMFLRYLARQSADLHISNTTSNTVINTFYGDDTVYTAASNVTIQTGDGNDSVGVNTKGKNSTIESGAGNDRINNWGANFYIDTGADDDYIYNSSVSANTTINTGAGKDSVNNWAAGSSINTGDGNDNVTSTANNVKIYCGSGNDSIRNGVALNGVITKIQNITIDGGEGADTIRNFYAEKVSINGGSGKDSIYSGYIYDGVAYGDNVTISGGTDADFISISSASKNNLIIYNNGDGNDTVYGLNEDDTLKITGAKYSTLQSGNDIKFSVGSGSILVKSGVNVGFKTIGTLQADPTPTLPSGWKYGNTAKTNLTASVTSAANIDLTQTYGKSVVSVDGSKITTARSFTGNAKANLIKGGSGSDTINGGAGNDTLYGGSGNDKLFGDAGNDKLLGEIGNDSLNGGAGNNTLTGGKGNDIFIYGGGNDTITDYTAGQDKIKFNVAITSNTVSGSNIIFKTAKGNVTVQNCKDKKITLIDSSGKETTKIYPENPLPTGWKYGNTAKTNMTASIASAANIDLTKTYGTSVVTVDGSKITTARSFTGNTKANLIKGGSGSDTIDGGTGADILYGGSGNDKIYGNTGNDKLYGDAGNDSLYGDTGNDSLYGGAGNDTLTGGTGNDVFIYEGGKDVITDYTAGQDKIKISSGKITNKSYKNNDVVFTIGSGTLTVQKAKGKNISVTDSSNKTQTYSKTLDLMYDDNFVTDEFEIDSITEEKVDVTEIQNTDTATFAKDENILTYSEDK